ncbi:transmembrane protein 184C [Diorhabda sublineata]|uniref:transmembrane protein 184C n=1 Tax=Diorhabda sublineata TaxID=1163346 RepID=UPI0024E0C0AD|nr:transmembrane protein 184C [Diorhabda sublineata]XP_056649205.1 transmembrane protein 184C [Diorhabda sublineata]XP_056649206.1 transmembrane protein 184C [Diorhabda sublineata]
MCHEGCLNCMLRWKLWIRPLFILLYALAALVFVPLFLVKSLEDGFNKHDQEILIGGVFVWVAIPLSLWEIIQHVTHYVQPKLQKHVIRILWMVPIYAINAWLGLIYPEQSVVVDSLRECYEAFVIYNFMVFLLNYLNMEMDLEASLELKPQVKHIFPLCCLPEWEMGRPFVYTCKHGILQYTIIRPLTTAISIVCKSYNVYGDGEFKASVAFPYLLIVDNISQFLAMYCLVMFYKASAAELRPMKPLPKFLCIKAVVFFSFFQGVLIQFAVYFEIIKPGPDSDQDGLSLSTRLQDFLICIEMCLASIAHHYSFSYEQYLTADSPSRGQSCFYSFLAMWDMSDVRTDVREHLGIVSSSISRRIRGKSMYSIPRGEDEYSNLVSPRMPNSMPNPGYYQNENDDTIIVNYGTVNSSQPAKVHASSST